MEFVLHKQYNTIMTDEMTKAETLPDNNIKLKGQYKGATHQRMQYISR